MSNPVPQPTSDRAAPEPAHLQRYAEYYRRHGTPCEVFNGALWIESRRVIQPIGAASANYSLTKSQVRYLLSRFKSGLMVACTDGFQAESQSQWYCVIARKFVELDKLDAKVRYKIRHGLRNCVVEKVDVRRVASEGYDTYCAAIHRYSKGQQQPPKSPEKFTSSILVAQEFADVIDFWAVFHEGRMVGYHQMHLDGTEEAGYSATAFHPDFFKFHTSYALIYTMNEYYLVQRGFAYANDGYRSVLHETDFQDFLIRDFHFERARTNLELFYRFPLGAIMACRRRSGHG